jgi:hypothetical protein
MSANSPDNSEQRILLIMRKLLASIVRETTPEPGMKHTLSEHTRTDIRLAFQLISTREQELAKESGIEIKERPSYPDQPRTSSVVSIKSISKPSSKPDEDA